MKFTDYDPPPIDTSPEKIKEVALNGMILESSFKNLETVKNRDILPIGTRVKNAFHKIDVIYGVVVEYTEKEDKMYVLWDGQKTPIGPYYIYELRRVNG